MTTTYDAIVVGARCAGAPTATLLAKAGHRVLLVDRSTFPSDTVSTLVIHAPGVSALVRWGVLDDIVASGCPPIDRYTFDFGPVVISGTPHPDNGSSTAYAPRRTVLDKLLVDAAVAAGVEVREGYTVEELTYDDAGSVTGIRGHGSNGSSANERARVVIGADGLNSRVARSVSAEEYNTKPVLENAFYTFWSGLPDNGFNTIIRGDRGMAAIPTNDGQTLVLVGCPIAQAASFKADVEANYLAVCDLEPSFAEQVHVATREDRFYTGGVPNFFRVPYGPGWALVGDAGYTKDPITAQGISDAFRDAERCAAALHEWLSGESTYDGAMALYQKERDERAMPIYEFTTQMATLEPPPPEMGELMMALATSHAGMDAFVSVTAGTLSPAEFFAPDYIPSLLQIGEVPAG